MQTQCNEVAAGGGLSILLVDDEPSVLSAVSRVLKPAGYTVVTAQNGEEAIALLQKQPFAIVITDSTMPGLKGVDLLRYIKQYHSHVVSLMLSGQAEFSTVVELLNNGLVNRYLSKPWNNTTLLSEVEHAVALHVSHREFQWSERVRQLTERLRREPHNQQGSNVVAFNAYSSLIVIKVVNVNDIGLQYGVSIIDALFGEISSRIMSVVGRQVKVENEENGLISLYLKRTSQSNLEALCIALRKKLQCTYGIGQESIFCHIGVGYKCLANGDVEPTVLIRSLEMAILKRINKEMVTHLDDNAVARFQRQQQLRSGMQRALANDSFKLAFQPKVALDTGMIEGAEVLLRWHHETLGNIVPTEIFKLAELDGQMDAIGDWVVYNSIRCAAGLVRFSPDIHTVSINISARQLRSGNLIQTLKSALLEYGLSPGIIELELAENTVARGDEVIRNLLWQLKLVGVRIAIDDFGAGYTSISTLSSMPLDTLKLDRSLTDNVERDMAKAEVVSSLIQTCHKQGINVIAEGVESELTLKWLARFECDAVQGFVFSKAVSRQEFEKLIIQQPFRQLCDK